MRGFPTEGVGSCITRSAFEPRISVAGRRVSAWLSGKRSLAAVSRYYAIGQRGRARVSGFTGRLFWLVVHLTFLTGFKNRSARSSTG